MAAKTPAFIDEAEITVAGGDGGDGIVSFLRERARPKGGPNGGNGGRGGDVVLTATRRVNTLLEYRYKRRITAAAGKRGMGKNRHGADGGDVLLQAPLGTRVLDADTGGVHAELLAEGERVLLAEGGRGGLGNACFKTSVNRAPRMATEGGKGIARRFRLELRVLADIGLVGLPNAGKSTLLRAMSAARPKVADYPFTTLAPQLGFIGGEDGGSGAVVADIPGLIRGAAAGAGLGNRFLRHLSRTRLLCQVVDAAAAAPADDCAAVDEELAAAGGFAGKPRWLIMNKTDCLPQNARAAAGDDLRRRFPVFQNVLAVSARTGDGVDGAVRRMLAAVGG